MNKKRQTYNILNLGDKDKYGNIEKAKFGYAKYLYNNNRAIIICKGSNPLKKMKKMVQGNIKLLLNIKNIIMDLSKGKDSIRHINKLDRAIHIIKQQTNLKLDLFNFNLLEENNEVFVQIIFINEIIHTIKIELVL